MLPTQVTTSDLANKIKQDNELKPSYAIGAQVKAEKDKEIRMEKLN